MVVSICANAVFPNKSHKIRNTISDCVAIIGRKINSCYALICNTNNLRLMGVSRFSI